jgi:hypothetical protein
MMKVAQILRLSKCAHELTPINVVRKFPMRAVALLGGTALAAPLLPWNTAGAIKDRMQGTEHEDQLSQSIATDTGRGIGTALGAGAVRGLGDTWHLPKTSPLFNLALVLGGAGVGGFLGHRQGKMIGQDLFPGSLSDRIHRAANRF